MDLAHCQQAERESEGEKAAYCNSPFFSSFSPYSDRRFLFFFFFLFFLFSGFTQITSSCSQILREGHWLRNAVSPLLHAEDALHFSPGGNKKEITLFYRSRGNAQRRTMMRGRLSSATSPKESGLAKVNWKEE